MTSAAPGSVDRLRRRGGGILWTMRLFACTRDGALARIDGEGSSWAAAALEGMRAQCVAAAGSRVLVGTRGHGVLITVDGGERWERTEIGEPDVFSVAI